MSCPRAATALTLIIAGCVTINVYFPERQLQEAAEEIVDEVRPDVASTPTEPPAPPPPAGDASPPPAEQEKKTTSSFIELFRTRSAFAEEKKDEKDIQIQKETPVIKKIKETLRKRYPKLLPSYESGAIGEGLDGYLAERDTAGLGLKERRDLQALIKEENADRKSLYTELATANNVAADYIPAIGRLFAKEWQKKCKTGWWIEVEAGKWEKKPAPKK